MDQEYMVKMSEAFLDELQEIEKTAFAGGVARFLTKGVQRLGKGMQNVGKPGGFAAAVGGKGAERAGGVGAHMKKIYQVGKDRAHAVRTNEMLGGLKALGRSRYGQVAGAAAVPLAAGYALS